MTEPAAGDNAPPTPALPTAYSPASLAEAKKLRDDTVRLADDIIAKGPIQDDATSRVVTDINGALRAAKRKIDDLRAEQKRPHMAAAEDVQKTFKDIEDAVDKAIKRLAPLAAAWITKENDRIAAEKEAQRIAAQKAEADAFAAQQLAEAKGDSIAMAEAESATKAAAKMVAQAERPADKARMESATGAVRSISMRKTKTAVIGSFNAVYMHFKDHPDVIEVLQRLANAAVRSPDWKEGDIKSVTVNITETPV